MNILTAREYTDKKIEFLHKHNDWQVVTSPMEQDGTYHKDYICEDGAHWFEVMRPVWDTAEVEIRKVKIIVDVEFLETEGWNTEDSTSLFYYEKF